MRYVSRFCCAVVTVLSHQTVYLKHPGDWQWSQVDMDIMMIRAARRELALIIFVYRWGLSLTLRRIMLINWIFRSTCFFMHSMPHVEVLEIIGRSCSPVNVPLIPYPFMVPPSIRRLVLQGCSLLGHSVDGMLLPGTLVEDLAVVCSYQGFMVCLLLAWLCYTDITSPS